MAIFPESLDPPSEFWQKLEQTSQSVMCLTQYLNFNIHFSIGFNITSHNLKVSVVQKKGDESFQNAILGGNQTQVLLHQRHVCCRCATPHLLVN